MNLEGIEQTRSRVSTETMEVLGDIIKDKSIDIKDRLAAAKLFDSMSDSIIHAFLLTQAVTGAERNNRNTLNELRRLKEDDK